ncbi:aminoglycoside phosphotransferase family protein [Ruania alba]|nr:aminoglycoside phosphotransferase family protein [Ruania alba]
MMHSDQLTISPPDVTALLQEQFPHLAHLPVRAVDSHGTVNALFRLGEDLVARFPLQASDDAAAMVQREVDAARRLLECSPVRTPVPVGVGKPGASYPVPWLIVEWLPGTTAQAAAAPDWRGVAVGLADFIQALARMPTQGRTFDGQGRGGDLTSHDATVAECLDRGAHLVDAAPIAELWAQVRDLPRSRPDAWVHNDLMPGNILVAPAEGARPGWVLDGVIDVGSLQIADPAVDLQPAWNCFDAPARTVFRERIGVDDVTWDRGRAWALVQALPCLWYYEHTNPVMSQTALHTLRALVEDASRPA